LLVITHHDSYKYAFKLFHFNVWLLSFLPRGAMHKRSHWNRHVSYHTLWPGVRLSVCLSVTFVHSILTAEDIVKLLSRPGSPIILVF